MHSESKRKLLESIKHIDKVLTSSDLDPVLDYKTHVINEKFDVLVIPSDDKNKKIKQDLCDKLGMKLVEVPKGENISTTSILANIKEILELPLRVDFAGGWLDVPKHSIKDGYIVNCTITPKVSLKNWPYKKGSGLGGSAAFRLLEAKNSVETEFKLGVGWQDPAVIMETGLCVWRSGPRPVLDFKTNPDWLKGKMLIYWTGQPHTTFDYVDYKRDYKLIKEAGEKAALAVRKQSLKILGAAVKLSYKAQLKEGMSKLPEIKDSIAKKYLGGGHGGYALYIFSNEKKRELALKSFEESLKIEPYIDEY